MKVTLTNDDGREYNITEHFRVMYDQLVSSMDWGSGFLSGGEALVVMQAGAAAGFNVMIGQQVDKLAPFFPPYATDVKREGETYQAAYQSLLKQRNQWLKDNLGDPPTWESIAIYRERLQEMEDSE